MRLHGISYLCGHLLDTYPSPEAIGWLAGIRQHIDSLDPMEIGAGALLEAQGYQRSSV